MFSEKEEDASTSESGVEEELHALLGAFASYHRVQKQGDSVPEGVNVRFGVGGRDERVFASRTSLEFEVNRWDADELGRAPVVHTWDLTPAAADRLNRELLPAATLSCRALPLGSHQEQLPAQRPMVSCHPQRAACG